MGTIEELIGADFHCPRCGRQHRVTLRDLVYQPGAWDRLPELFQKHCPGKRVRLLADQRTFQAAGEGCRDALEGKGFQVSVHLVPDPAPGESPVCDDITREMMEREIGPCDGFLAVGSGVISDLVKWIAFHGNLPYVVVPTAASMNGYTADNIAPAVRGVKTLLHGRGPVAVAADPEVLQRAPYHLTAAGLGDVLAKSVSSADWRLNRILFGDYCCEFCIELQMAADRGGSLSGEGLRSGSSEAMRALFEALALTGLLQSMAGTSAPASGGEHTVSHTLDMMSSLDHRPHDLHGRQVGIGTVFAAALYEEVLRMEKPVFSDPANATDSRFWGRLAAVVEEQHAKKRAKVTRATRLLEEDPTVWTACCEAVRPLLRSPLSIREQLEKAGAACRLSDIGVDRGRFLSAVAHLHEIRDRFTIVDVARMVSILPARAEELVDRWLED